MFLGFPWSILFRCKFVCFVSRRGSLSVSKLSRLLLPSIETSLREPEYDMDELTTTNSLPEVGKCLHKGLRSCGKSAAITPAEAKCEHDGNNVPGVLQDGETTAHVVAAIDVIVYPIFTFCRLLFRYNSSPVAPVACSEINISTIVVPNNDTHCNSNGCTTDSMDNPSLDPLSLCTLGLN